MLVSESKTYYAAVKKTYLRVRASGLHIVSEVFTVHPLDGCKRRKSQDCYEFNGGTAVMVSGRDINLTLEI
jgi:hypothetical protein